MKKLSLLFTVFLSLSACVSAPRYIPQTMFPHGPIQVSQRINLSFSTPLHKFIELEFFNDNKEWVEIRDFTLETSKEKPSEVVTDQESLDQWVQSRANEKIYGAGHQAQSMSFGFALLGLGVAIAEIASGSHHSDASTAAFIASDTFAVAAAIEEGETLRNVDQSLKNAPLSSKISLPPGRSVIRWFVVNTPDQDLPERFYINYTAQGRISGVEKPHQIELINDTSQLLGAR